MTPTIRFRDEAANTERLKIDERLIAVIALIADDFLDACMASIIAKGTKGADIESVSACRWWTARHLNLETKPRIEAMLVAGPVAKIGAGLRNCSGLCA
jgi:hypothetical protein